MNISASSLRRGKARKPTVPDISSTAARNRVCVVVSREDLDSRSVLNVGHGNVLDVDVRYDIRDSIVLSQRPDTDAVGSITDHVEYLSKGGVGLEGNAIVAVDDRRVLYDNVVGSVGVPCENST